ncbi:oxysterol-binding protein 2-like isoform X2 [Melanerpes formicivorus]|uniref:oxysterol-binding protein 2-like isoform X2 n=1 Tax=Melanerpes formicivorus TaxID=211600 RepID=UPI00358EE2B2
MGKAAALCGGGNSTRGLVSLLSAVPCLACQELPAMSAEPGGRGGGGAAGGPPAAPGSDTYKGWLFKWTNYLKGYQRRWFVLSNGLLSYYRTQAEMAHTCRGTINLSTAHIDTEDSCNIVLSSGGRTYHLKASSEVERQRWVTALELAKARAIRIRNNQSGGQLQGD